MLLRQQVTSGRLGAFGSFGASPPRPWRSSFSRILATPRWGDSSALDKFTSFCTSTARIPSVQRPAN